MALQQKTLSRLWIILWKNRAWEGKYVSTRRSYAAKVQKSIFSMNIEDEHGQIFEIIDNEISYLNLKIKVQVTLNFKNTDTNRIKFKHQL